MTSDDYFLATGYSFPMLIILLLAALFAASLVGAPLWIAAPFLAVLTLNSWWLFNRDGPPGKRNVRELALFGAGSVAFNTALVAFTYGLARALRHIAL